MSMVSYQKHQCPVAQTLAVLGDQWTLLIVRDALSGLRRFNEIQKSLGISRNLLTQRLGQLCDAGILERVPIEGSKRQAYVPTEKCRDLRIVILAIAKWGEKWRTGSNIRRVDVLEEITGRPVTVEFYQREDGKIVEPDNIKVIRHGDPKDE